MKSDVYKSIFSIPKMDCPCEENLIRMKLQEVGGIFKLDFDLAERKLTVLHIGDPGSVETALKTLGLGAALIVTEQTEDRPHPDEPSVQRRVLIIVLLINFAFFLVEIATGIISGSMGLVADSLDMLADALVYGMSLMVVGAVLSRKKKVARYSGYIQIVLALACIRCGWNPYRTVCLVSGHRPCIRPRLDIQRRCQSGTARLHGRENTDKLPHGKDRR